MFKNMVVSNYLAIEVLERIGVVKANQEQIDFVERIIQGLIDQMKEYEQEE